MDKGRFSDKDWTSYASDDSETASSPLRSDKKLVIGQASPTATLVPS